MKVSPELIPAASLNLNEVTIDIGGLYKHYGKTIAIRGIDLQIRRGELFGLIGPDGAGKTTTFNILGGVMEATAGLYATNLFVPAQWKGERFPDAIDRGTAQVQVTIPHDFASEVQAGKAGNLQVVIDGSFI